MNSHNESLPAPEIVLSAVSKSFESGQKKLQVLETTDLTISSGSVTAIVGPSGCGKSTLLRMVAGLEQPDNGGRLTIGGEDPYRIRSRGELAMAFQDASLLPWRSVTKNVELGQELAGQPKDSTQIRYLLKLVGLEGFEDAHPAELSGGMRQRAAIARCLITNPRVLLLDEPFGAVDELTRRRLNIELPHLWSGKVTTTLLVTHSISEAVFLADRVLVLSERPGKLVADIPINLSRPRQAQQLTGQHFRDLTSQVSEHLGVNHVDF